MGAQKPSQRERGHLQPAPDRPLRLAGPKSIAIALLLPALSLQGALGQTAAQDQPRLRCGWFTNPTPGNAGLIDRDGEWLIGMQGGHQAEGDWPEFRKNEWVRTNRSYGHGCACMKVIADRESMTIQRILSAKARPLSVCRQDPALSARRPEN